MSKKIDCEPMLITLTMTPEEANDVISSTGFCGHHALADLLSCQLKRQT